MIKTKINNIICFQNISHVVKYKQEKVQLD